jgi:hypothetical protein
MLPDEVDKACASSSTAEGARDAEKEPARYLDEHAPERRVRPRGGHCAAPDEPRQAASQRAGRRLVEQPFSPEDRPSRGDRRICARRDAGQERGGT